LWRTSTGVKPIIVVDLGRRVPASGSGVGGSGTTAAAAAVDLGHRVPVSGGGVGGRSTTTAAACHRLWPADRLITTVPGPFVAELLSIGRFTGKCA